MPLDGLVHSAADQERLFERSAHHSEHLRGNCRRESLPLVVGELASQEALRRVIDLVQGAAPWHTGLPRVIGEDGLQGVEERGRRHRKGALVHVGRWRPPASFGLVLEALQAPRQVGHSSAAHHFSRCTASAPLRALSTDGAAASAPLAKNSFTALARLKFCLLSGLWTASAYSAV